MILRVDGDVLVYAAGFSVEHTFHQFIHDGVVREFETRKAMLEHAESLGLKPGQYQTAVRRVVEPVQNAYYNVRNMIGSMQEDLQVGPDETVVYLSGPSNFRVGLATILPYKGNRDPAHKPVHAADIKAFMRRAYTTVTSEDEEADDKIACDHYATWTRDPHGSVIATIDKDLDMIPGLHYNFRKKETYDISPDRAIWCFYRQCLTGDRTDNIPGIDGIGNARAEKLLPGVGAGEHELYRTVLARYRESFGEAAEARLLEVGRLLWIRRNPGEWWNPPV